MASKKTIFVVLVVVVVLLVGLGVWLGVSVFNAQASPSGPSPYSAVYLTTGEIYYGKLSWFPSPRLTDVWFLQAGAQNAQGKSQLAITPFKSAFWGPVDEIYLNAKQIIFWTNLRNDSQLAQALANPSSLQQQSAASSYPSPSSTPTFQGPASSPPTK